VRSAAYIYYGTLCLAKESAWGERDIQLFLFLTTKEPSYHPIARYGKDCRSRQSSVSGWRL